LSSASLICWVSAILPLRRLLAASHACADILPITTRWRLPSAVRSKTMIGSELSMHKEIAVESIDFRPRLSTSM